MSILTWRLFGRPQTPAETHTAATVRREPTGQAEASFLLSVPSACPVTITTEQAEHVMSLVTEYGGLVRQECQYDQLSKGERFGANVDNRAHARRMQQVYAAEIEGILKGERP